MAGFADMINGTPQMMGPGQGSGNIGQVVMPQAEQTGLNQTPPKSPEELQQRVGAWQNFIQKMQTDPILQNAMLMTGAQMLAGPQFMGENTSSILGRAVQTGILSHQMGKAAEAKSALATRTENRADAASQAQIGSLNASTEATQQKVASDKELTPAKRKKLEAETQAAEQTATNQPKILESNLQTAESIRAKNYALANKAQKVPGMGNPSVTSEVSKLYEIANPDATPQEIAKMVLAHNKKADKTGGSTDTAKLTTLRSLFEKSTDDGERKMYQDLIHQSLGLDAPGGTAETKSGKESPITEEEFKAASKKADANGKFKLRGKEYTLKSGVKP